VELEAGGETLVIDPMLDAGAVFAAYGELAADLHLPEVIAPAGARSALAGLVTHLHRDHADADALSGALKSGARLYGPRAGGGGPMEELGTAQAAAELERASLELQEIDPWTTFTEGPFEITAVPAVDGSGDPQVSWIVAAEGRRILHAGDTMWHGYWWRMAHRYGHFDVAFLPINGAAVNFPHRQPESGLPAAMTPEHAAAAAAALRTGLAVPIHYDGYEFDPYYRPVDNAADTFAAGAAARGVATMMLRPGDLLHVHDVAKPELAA